MAEKSYQQRIKETGANDFAPKTLAKRNNLRYNNKDESDLLDQYMRQVDNGAISPLSGYKNYREQYYAIQDKLIGITTSDGIEITAQSIHFIERVIGGEHIFDNRKKKFKGYRSGVDVEAIRDALVNPLDAGDVKYDDDGRPSQTFIGKYATVSVNPETHTLIQCNPTHKSITKGFEGE